MTVTADPCLLGGGAAGGCGDDDKWPPGFRFHPTDEELVLYYLKRKMCKRRLRADPIRVLDVYKWDPEELPGQSLLKTGDRQWFFFSPKDRKYPNGARSNRATRQGYWKATGKDRNITCNSRIVGLKKTLVFYRGRAPHGGRTDWVMHEYTLDEQELRRCPQVLDYYALYKIYKKSGPGPKNGEQYGAPFREEDWADEEDVVKINVNSEISVKQDNEVPHIDDAPVLGEVEPILDEVEGIFEQINDEPQVSDYLHVHHQAGGEETQSTLVNPSFLEMSYTDAVKVLPVGAQQYEDRASVEVNQSANIDLQLQDGPEVTSASKTSEQENPACEGDFLEIEDLLSPQLNASNHERPVENVLNAVQPTFTDADKFGENLSVDDLDGLGAFDLFYDTEMFLRDMGSFDGGAVPNQYVNSLGVDSVNQDGYQLQLHSLASQENFNYQLQSDSLAIPENMNYQFQPTSMANQVDYQLPSGVNQVDNQFFVQSFDTDQMNNELLAQDNNSNHMALSGAVHASSNNPSGANGNQNSTEGGGAGSWFSSYLWNYVDSIPSSPAFASENPLVNKALGRMPSFSRLRTSVKSTDTIVGNAAANARRAGGNKGFILLSILGALCAMLWVLIGSVGVFGRSISL